MKNLIFFVLFILLVFILTCRVKAAETLAFDSTDNYLGACLLTDKSDWELKEDIQVTKFQVWYNWNQGETTLPVKVFFEGKTFAEFEATRSQCDPYQHQWCNADYQINKLFVKGKYSTEITNKRQCLKPNGTGAIRLYKDDGASATVKKTEPSPKSEAKTESGIQPTTTINNPGSCSCSRTTIIVTTVITSLITSGLVVLFLRR